MAKTTIEKLGEWGQSVWLDNISRSLIESARLKEMLGLGLAGITSNPTIFDKAISSSNDYDARIAQGHQEGKSVFEIYDELTVSDVQDAADMFRPLYEKTNRLDGYVSLEINPQLARMSKETIEEGKRLHKKVNRPNVMLKVPATEEGFTAMEELLGEGININATLIFSQEQYAQAAYTFLRGMKKLSNNQNGLGRVFSVASVFVSRIDTVADALIDKLIATENNPAINKELQALKGKAAVANSKLIFKKYLDIFSSREFLPLKENGANAQRVLWGSTGTKNLAYSPIKYVTELIGKATVNTMPQNTFEAFLSSGVVKEALSDDIRDAQGIIKRLDSFGIALNDICLKLLEEGIIAFKNSFDSLLNSIENKAKKQIKSAVMA